MSEKREEKETCKCGHPFDPHVLVAYENPLDGGLMFCQEPGCRCVHTWGVDGIDDPESHVMPPPHVVEEYRQVARNYYAEG